MFCFLPPAFLQGKGLCVDICTFISLCSFVRPLRELKFCVVQPRVFDELRCAAGVKILWDTVLEEEFNFLSFVGLYLDNCTKATSYCIFQ
jgi:hypothetical protein